jgi:hypothetical protein
VSAYDKPIFSRKLLLIKLFEDMYNSFPNKISCRKSFGNFAKERKGGLREIDTKPRHPEQRGEAATR